MTPWLHASLQSLPTLASHVSSDDGASVLSSITSVMETLVHATVFFGLIVTMLGMLLCLYRLIRGPHISDRALAVDTLGIHLIALVTLLSFQFETLAFFDGIMVLSLLGFAGGVAMAQYIGQPYLKKLGQSGQPFNPTHGPEDAPSHTRSKRKKNSTTPPSATSNPPATPPVHPNDQATP